MNEGEQEQEQGRVVQLSATLKGTSEDGPGISTREEVEEHGEE